MLRTTSKSLLGRGLALLAMGIVSIAWPGITLSLVAAIFAVVALVVSSHEFQRAFASKTVGPVVGHLLLGLLDVAAGVGALAWPGITAMVLTLWIGVWALVAGAMEFGLAFESGETAGERAFFGLGGLLGFALGLVLLARPDIGAVALAQLLGFFSLAYGTWNVIMATRLHSAAVRLDKVVGKTA